MPSNSMMQIDSEKLSAILKKRNLNAVEISRKIGYNDHYISQAIVRGKMSKPTAVALKNYYNIDREDYEWVEKPESNPEPASTAPDPIPACEPIDYDRLGTIIYNAVYEAVKKAWSE